MQHGGLLDAVCDLVAEIRRARCISPALTAMREECEVELFLVVPRMIWLRLLAEPPQHTELLHSQLPRRFPPVPEGMQKWEDSDVEAFKKPWELAARTASTPSCAHSGLRA